MISIDHEITIQAAPSVVYQAISTGSGLQGWFSKHVEGCGEPLSSWQMAPSDSGIRFHWQVEKSEPNGWIAWRCLEGPGDAAGTTVEFRILATERGTKLRFSHAGWPHTAGNFIRCNTLWGGLLHRLSSFAESGVANPLYH